MNEDAIIEAIIVGLLTVIIGMMVSQTVKHFNDYTCDPNKHDCTGKNMYYFVFFLTGVVIYYFCELSGINETYCRKKCGPACAAPQDQLDDVVDDFFEPSSDFHVSNVSHLHPLPLLQKTEQPFPRLATLKDGFEPNTRSVFIKFAGVNKPPQQSPFDSTSPVMIDTAHSMFNTPQSDTSDVLSPIKRIFPIFPKTHFTTFHGDSDGDGAGNGLHRRQ